MKIGPIDTVTILTHDLSKSVAMYISAFGWQEKGSEYLLRAEAASRWQATNLIGARVLEVCGINGGVRFIESTELSKSAAASNIWLECLRNLC